MHGIAIKGIKFIAGDPAVKIDRPRKVVYTEKGETVDYDRLIIATGSKPFIPPVQGVDLKGVISFRDIYDVNTMIKYCETKKCSGDWWWFAGLRSCLWFKATWHECHGIAFNGSYYGASIDGRASQMFVIALKKKAFKSLLKPIPKL
jgi:hypothetical protein